MSVYVRSGGALWPMAAFLRGRLAALAVPNVRDRAVCELVAVVVTLGLVAEADSGEVAA
jgi:hypothetical protein